MIFGHHFFIIPDPGLALTEGGAAFQYGFGPGYLFKLKKKGSIDVSLHINRAGPDTWLSFGAGHQSWIIELIRHRRSTILALNGLFWKKLHEKNAFMIMKCNT